MNDGFDVVILFMHVTNEVKSFMKKCLMLVLHEAWSAGGKKMR